MRRWSFAKGHGTENDFVLLLDRDDLMSVGEAEVRFLCDRRTGIGGDGLLRAVRAKHIESWSGDAELWFMDYRNADGSIAEMCANGVRVFAKYLLDEGLASGPTIPIATRAGLKEATLLADGRVIVAMGPVEVRRGEITVRTAAGVEFAATAVDVGNPHAVIFCDDLEQLSLHPAPTWAPAEAFPDGVNLEFVRSVGPDHLAMRVLERGSGETRSCGTGTVAAAAAARQHRADPNDLPVTFRVDTPGGTVEVELTAEQAYLTGPAVIVAHGQVAVPDA